MKTCPRCGINSGRFCTGVCMKCYNTERKQTIGYMESQRRRQYRLDLMKRLCNGIIHCKCCGESNLIFLQIDHINNDGHLRQEVSYKLKLEDPDSIYKYQVLCANCHLAKTNSQVCPHEEQRILREYASAMW